MRDGTTTLRLAALVAFGASTLVAADRDAGRTPERPVETRPLRAPLVIDCGPGPDDDHPGRVRMRGGVLRLPDRPWTRAGGWGSTGGEGQRPWTSAATGIWGAEDPDLFASFRSGPVRYRLDVPPGDYLLGLGFCELEAHVPGQRVFDVLAGGEVIVRALDPVAEAGRGQAFWVTRRVRIEAPGPWSLNFRKSEPDGWPPAVSAIRLLPWRPSAAPPPAPERIEARGSYGLAFLTWRHPDDPRITGYVVERREGREGEGAPRLRPAGRGLRWIDRDVVPGAWYRYRVASVGVDATRGPWSRTVEARVRSPDESTLPVYSVRVPEDELWRILAEPMEKHQAAGVIRYGRAEWPIRLRVRGASSRLAAKKSFRIRIRPEGGDEGFPYPPPGRPRWYRRVVYLKAEPLDFTLQQEALTCDVFASLGLPVSSAQHVQLFINDRYQGVYLDIDPVNSLLAGQLGLTRDYIYRAGSFQHLEEGPLSGERGAYRKRHLNELLWQLNRVDRGEFGDFVRAAMQWKKVRGYFAASVVCHRSEIESDDFFYHYHQVSRRWRLIPWDHNNGNFGVNGLGRRIGEPNTSIWGQSLQGVGREHGWWYLLPSRIFQTPSLREDYLDALELQTRAVLLSPRIGTLIDANWERVAREGIVDPYRWPPDDPEPFLGSRHALARFARAHGERIIDQVEDARRHAPDGLEISEFELGPDGGWVELHQRGERAASLRGHSLVADIRRRWPRLALPEDVTIPPGGRHVVRVRRVELPPPPRGEEGERLEMEERERAERGLPPLRPFAGFDPAGGTMGLVGPERGLLDWYVYGPRAEGVSYGRLGPGHAAQRPTPGRPNEAPGFLPPPIILNGDFSGRRQSTHLRVHALLLDHTRTAPLASATLHYRYVDEWRAAEMAPVAERPERLPTQFRLLEARIPLEPGAQELTYWFEGRTADGLIRRCPMTAPRDVFERWIKDEDD